jgi:sugar fermentation stimulation protein A
MESIRVFDGEIVKASFLSRPNRFIVICKLEGKRLRAYLPNPGRLRELFFPGVTIWLERSHVPGRRTAWTAVAVERDGRPVVLHTHRMNDVAALLIERGLVPGLEGAAIVRREVVHGASRFDFLLRKGRREILLEVKSCTLFSERVAMFPDAVTQRGRKHVEELASLSGDGREGTGDGREGMVLFVVNSPVVACFLPDFHTDLEFARSLLAAREKVAVIPLSVEWNPDLSLCPRTRLLDVPWHVVERDARDAGCYLVILRLPRRRAIAVGSLGTVSFPAGYHIYVGSAARSLSKRVARHRRLRKRMHWHIDYLRALAEWHAALPILTADDLECDVAKSLRALAGPGVRGFGSSDCSCSSHLFHMAGDPLLSPPFHSMLQHYRMERPSRI